MSITLTFFHSNGVNCNFKAIEVYGGGLGGWTVVQSRGTNGFEGRQL